MRNRASKFCIFKRFFFLFFNSCFPLLYSTFTQTIINFNCKTSHEAQSLPKANILNFSTSLFFLKFFFLFLSNHLSLFRFSAIPGTCRVLLWFCWSSSGMALLLESISGKLSPVSCSSSGSMPSMKLGFCSPLAAILSLVEVNCSSIADSSMVSQKLDLALRELLLPVRRWLLDFWSLLPLTCFLIFAFASLIDYLLLVFLGCHHHIYRII